MLYTPLTDRKNKAESSNSTMCSDREPQQQTVKESHRERQQAYGNQAALQGMRSQKPLQGGILQRKCACGNAASTAGTCGECREKQEMALQTKLRISEPGDEYEREADRVAERIMTMPDPSLQHQMESEEEEEMVQRKAVTASITPLQSYATERDRPSEITPIVRKVLNSPGQPLEPSVRAFFEPRFGFNFSGVKLHTDALAAKSAKSINAIAYTKANHIVFDRGQYSTETAPGKRLLAHELTHIIQQNSNLESEVQRAKQVTYKPVHTDEQSLKGQTFEQSIMFRYTKNDGSTYTESDDVSIYVPSQVKKLKSVPEEDRKDLEPEPIKENEDGVKVLVFFTANSSVGDTQINDLLTHGLRGAAENSDRVVIALPSPDDGGTPNYRAFRTADIVTCLQAVNLSPNIADLRLAAHSRGHRGLTRTLMGNDNIGEQGTKERDPNTATINQPFVDISKISKISYFDDYYASAQRIVTHLEKPTNLGGFGLSKNILSVFKLTDGVPKFDNSLVNNPSEQFYTFDSATWNCVAAIGCLRLISDSAVLDPAVKTALGLAKNKSVNDQLTKFTLPARGAFVTKNPAPSGKQHMVDFCKNKSFDVNALVRFVNENNLARATPKFPQGFQWDIRLAAHHFFVYEFAQDLFQ